MNVGWYLRRMMLLAALGTGVAPAADIYVKTSANGGNDANAGDTWASAVASIQYAMTLTGAPGGDTIHVAAGTYAEHVQMGNNITLLGSYPATGGSVRDRLSTPSIIDGGGTLLPIDFNASSNDTIDGFVVTNGNNTADCVNAGIGGAISIHYANGVTLINNAITNSIGCFGGGVGIVAVTGMTLIGNEIRANSTYHLNGGLRDDRGGGLLVSGSTAVTVTGTTIAANQANDGGGLYLANCIGCVAQNNTIAGNHAFNDGGGVFQSADGQLLGNRIVGNRADHWGGGLMASYFSLTLTGNVIDGNTAGNGGGIAWQACSALLAEGNTITGNGAGADGGGIYHSLCNGSLLRNTIQDNTAGNWGGGICIRDNAHPTALTNNLITDNTATGFGGGISFYAGSSATIRNATLARNQAGGGGGVYVHSDSTAAVSNSILWGNLPQQLADAGVPAVAVAYSTLAGGWPGVGNLSADPRFRSTTDFHLAAASPAIDHGTAVGAPANDLEGHPRPTGLGVDMGAYEAGARRTTDFAVPALSGQSYTTGAVPEGPAGTFRFSARFCNRAASGHTGVGLFSRTLTLTNGNSLINRTRPGPGTPAGGVGAELDFPLTGQYSDGQLAPGECVVVPFVIGLQQRKPFLFYMDVIGY